MKVLGYFFVICFWLFGYNAFCNFNSDSTINNIDTIKYLKLDLNGSISRIEEKTWISIYVKNDSNLRIKTSGHFEIVDLETIKIKDHCFDINNIEIIKKTPSPSSKAFGIVLFIPFAIAAGFFLNPKTSSDPVGPLTAGLVSAPLVPVGVLTLTYRKNYYIKKRGYVISIGVESVEESGSSGNYNF